jgi:hypothetical protein
MTPITFDWFALRAMWFAFGAVCMFVLLVLLAPVILSGRLSRQEEWTDWSVYSEPEPEPAPKSEIDIMSQLATEHERADFYLGLYTDTMKKM